MSRQSSGFTRRHLLRVGSSAAVAGLLGATPRAASEETSSSRVVLVRDPEVTAEDGTPRAEVLSRMVDEGVTALLQTESPAAAWKRLVKPDDIVGIKSNVWARLRTPPELEAALVDRMVAAGVAKDAVAVDDRGVRKNQVFQRATALVNVRPMRVHHWSGLGTCLKNYIMFVDRPSEYHGNACESLGAIWRLPQLEGKTRLNILLLLTPLFHGVGPHAFSSRYTWRYNGLVLGSDPVAVDATGARIIQEKRNDYFGEERPISPGIQHILAGETSYGLGVADPDRIQVIRRGPQDGALI
jgi:hypothetical protein